MHFSVILIDSKEAESINKFGSNIIEYAIAIANKVKLEIIQRF